KGSSLRTSGKELRKRLVKCFVWNVTLYETETWTLRQCEEKRLEAFEIMGKRTTHVKWTDRIRNEAVLERVDEKRIMLKLKLTGSLAKPKLPSEICNKRNDELKKSTGQKKISDDFYNFTFYFTKIKENRGSLELIDLHQLLVYADDVNMFGENPQTIREIMGILLEASNEFGLQANLEKTAEIKRSINMRNACCYSVEKLFLSNILSKKLKVRIHKTVALSVVMYGCETWTLILREEQRLRVLENKVLRRLFVTKREEVTGERRKLHNAELHALYSSPDIIIRNIKTRRLRWAGHVARMGESRNSYGVLDSHFERGTEIRVFENKVLRKIFGAKRDEVTGEWRKLHNAELHALYSSPDIIRNIKSRRLRWAGHIARMGESRNAYRVLVWSPAGKRPLGRPTRRWEDNIKMDLREVGYDGKDWINLAQDRDQWRAYVRAAMNLRVP
ncbi:hypothetical protein ANN_00598, partial [Periplaneta americana]